MKLEAGKRYLRRDGTLTQPLTQISTNLFRDPENGYVFVSERSCSDQPCVVYEGFAAGEDLVADITDPEDSAKSSSAAIDSTSLERGANPSSTAIDTTLSERGSNYGDFHSQAAISQELSEVMLASPNWAKLSHGQREALEMIQHKIARILNGNPIYLDSWVDIVGYAELGKRETERLLKESKD